MILGSINPPRYPIGESDYATLRRGGLTYVDKSMWVADVIDSSAKVLLVPRPRRFGKTLNMTTLRYFLERGEDDCTDIFEDTALWQADGGRYREQFRRYPVIYLSFKAVKEPTWEGCWQGVRTLIQDEARRLWTQFDLDRHFANDSQIPMRYAMLREPDAHRSSIINALAQLTLWLHLATGERAVVLIDEYDAPLHAAWEHGYWDEAMRFFRGFLTDGLKDNEHLHKGVLTGILKVAKEGIFSGLNHLRTVSILGDAMAGHFGFTESEVAALAHAAGRSGDLDVIRQWYNGYRFGEAERHTLYNPWSILNYLDEPGTGPRSFWKNTSDNALIHDLLIRHAAIAGPHVERLLQGDTVRFTLDENVPVQHLQDDPLAVFGLLTFSGYLTAESVAPTAQGYDCQLRIPNLEVRSIFEDTFLGWLRKAAARAATSGLSPLSDAMLAGDREAFERELGAILQAALSFMDFGHKPIEAIYQAFVVGLLVHLQDTHRVRSNRESGYGRADVLVLPRDAGPGAVLELKVIDTDYDETVETALERAVTQLQQRDYAAEVRDAGATTVHQYAVVFDGKRCWAQTVEA